VKLLSLLVFVGFLGNATPKTPLTVLLPLDGAECECKIVVSGSHKQSVLCAPGSSETKFSISYENPVPVPGTCTGTTNDCKGDKACKLDFPDDGVEVTLNTSCGPSTLWVKTPNHNSGNCASINGDSSFNLDTEVPCKDQSAASGESGHAKIEVWLAANCSGNADGWLNFTINCDKCAAKPEEPH